MLVPFGWTPKWRPHTKLHNFMSDILASNSSAESHTDLKVWKIVYLSIFYNHSFSWRQALISFDSIFRLRDSETTNSALHFIGFYALLYCAIRLTYTP